LLRFRCNDDRKRHRFRNDARTSSAERPWPA
jgi:hypothetical protein